MAAKTKILIVEDDAIQATMMVQVLSQAGCNVLVVPTGKRGMELARENKFDLIALDVGLPDINGFEICQELKQRHVSRHTPIVFISGRPSDEYGQRGLELGAADYIEKPFVGIDWVGRLLSHIKPKAAYA